MGFEGGLDGWGTYLSRATPHELLRSACHHHCCRAGIGVLGQKFLPDPSSNSNDDSRNGATRWDNDLRSARL